MTKAGSTDGPTRAAKRQERAERLSAALKANLRRRKAQARNRSVEADQPGHDLDTEPAKEPIKDLMNELLHKAPPDEAS